MTTLKSEVPTGGENLYEGQIQEQAKGMKSIALLFDGTKYKMIPIETFYDFKKKV